MNVVCKLSANHAFILMLCVNALAIAAWALDLDYLKTHRPSSPDPTHGFILRQDVARENRVFYETDRDRAIYWSLVGLDLLVFWTSAGAGYFFYGRTSGRTRGSGEGRTR